MFTIPELPELTGTEAQVSYATEIRAGHVRSIKNEGMFAGGKPFAQRVYEILGRILGPSRQEVERVKRAPGVDEAIQDAINAILGIQQAGKVIEGGKKEGTIAERVAHGAARRMGWTE